MNYHCIASEKFENEWVKAYSLIYDNFCSRDMQVALKELPDFDVRISDHLPIFSFSGSSYDQEYWGKQQMMRGEDSSNIGL